MHRLATSMADLARLPPPPAQVSDHAQRLIDRGVQAPPPSSQPSASGESTLKGLPRARTGAVRGARHAKNLSAERSGVLETPMAASSGVEVGMAHGVVEAESDKRWQFHGRRMDVLVRPGSRL